MPARVPAMTSSSPAARQGRPRIAALDAARALGVLAMVVGHTLDAVLSLSVRDEAVLVAYWKARGLTAPLFLMASGWAVATVVRRSGASGLGVVRGRLGRVLVLLGVGVLLRWPGWGTELLGAREPAVWAHLLAFDALHTIALSVLVASVVLALPFTVREKALSLAALASLAVALGMGGTAPLVPDPAALPPPVLGMALAQAAGGTSPFPLFPWAAYFFSGAIVGLVAGEADGRRARALTAVGVAMALATCWAGVGTMPPGHPVLFVFRTGVVLALFGALTLVPARLAARVAPVGRASLGVYAVHLPVVYGWSTHQGLVQRIGPVLPIGAALGVALAVLLGSLAVARGISLAVGAARSWAPAVVGAAGRRTGSAARS